MHDLKVGLVGAGWAARQHSESIVAIGGAKVVTVFDVDQQSRDSLARDLGASAAHTLEDLLAMETDVVVVCTPSGVHREAVVPALAQGKAVFVEKPLSRASEDAWTIVTAAEQSGNICAVGYQWRALDNLGSLGKDLEKSSPALLLSQGVGITQARSWFKDDRLSGGLLFERVSHHIDLQRMIAGDVSSVSAVRGAVALSGRSDPAEISDDVLSLTLRFNSGAVGVINVGWAPPDYPPTQSLSLHTTGSSFELLLDPDFVLVDKSAASPPRSALEHPFKRQMRSFLDAARYRDPSIVHCSARDAAGDVEVALAAESSLAGSGEHRRVGYRSLFAAMAPR